MFASLGCAAAFNTYCFLFLFLPPALIGYWAVPSRRWKLAWITLMSFVFYSFWDIRFVLLLVASSVVDFGVARRLAAATDPIVRKRWLRLSILFNLGTLGFFKYAVFGLQNVRNLFDLVGVPVDVPGYNIVLPVGISFYTFQTMSYTIDVYRGHFEPTRNFLKYIAFVTLFPQLVAGPIVRYRTLSDQLDALPRRLSGAYAGTGLMLLSMGLFKKVVIADLIAMRIDPLWSDVGALTTITAWISAMGFMLQLYFDFSGYSDMAIGLGALLGLRFPINFRAPFQALNPPDFWRRWHISLSTFLRDYLFVPLGGNKVSLPRWRFNVLLVMVLSGLWHGAAWTFILWGAYYGVLQIAYRRWGAAWDALPRVGQMIGFQWLVVVSGVLFRADNLGVAGAVYRAMFDPFMWGGLGALPLLAIMVALYAFTMIARPACDLRFRLRPYEAALVAIGLVIALLIIRLEYSPFLYYQF